MLFLYFFPGRSCSIIDVGAGKVSFTAIGVKDLPLVKTSRGHLAVDILDFDLDSFEETHAAEGEVVNQLETAHKTYVEDGCEPHNVPEGWSPVDWSDHLDHVSYMRAEVEAWEEFQQQQIEGRTNCEDPRDGEVAEDVLYFEETVAKDPAVYRKTTGRKFKKLLSLSSAVDGDDFYFRRVLSGKTPVPHRPPFGKTWVKQLFAGQMGITLLCVLAGMSVGVPLDYGISGWDATAAAGRKQLHNDLRAEDPYLTILTPPCGPWGPWGHFNFAREPAAATVESLRDDGRRVLKLVNDIVVERVRHKRHVFMEQPGYQQWLSEPELVGVNNLIANGELQVIHVRGCQLGYTDKETGLPHCKPVTFVTTLLVAESLFADAQCPGCQREELSGSNRGGPRTGRAASWPPELNQRVLETLIQQSTVELCAAHQAQEQIQEAFPADGHGQRRPLRPLKRRRQGRVSVLTDECHAPPVYLRPNVEPQLPDDVTERTLAELLDEPSAGSNLRYHAADGDDASHRAIMADQLAPTLSLSEQERRRRWLELDPDLRKCLRVQFGHPTNNTLQRILRRQGARPEAIRGVDLLSCDACGESHRRRRPKPVVLQGCGGPAFRLPERGV